MSRTIGRVYRCGGLVGIVGVVWIVSDGASTIPINVASAISSCLLGGSILRSLSLSIIVSKCLLNSLYLLFISIMYSVVLLYIELMLYLTGMINCINTVMELV